MSFLEDYRTYSKGNEAHPNYHLFAGLSILSTVIGRRIWVEHGYFKVFCNLYIVLVGPPGNRKTVAKNIALSVLRDIGDVPFSAEAQTKEKLVAEMSHADNERVFKIGDKITSYVPMGCYLTELKEFLGPNNAHMINFLTTIYDIDFYDYKTIKDGTKTIVNPYLTILACETPDWITSRLKDDVISGGFSRRALYINEVSRPDRIPFPVISTEAAEARVRLVQRGKELKDVVGCFTWEPSAHEFYETWYKNLHIPTDTILAGYYDTKHVFVLKIAMLVCISEGNKLVMTKEYLEAAMGILSIAEVNMAKVFAGMGANLLNGVAFKLMGFLEQAHGPLAEKKIRALLFQHTDERGIEQVLNNVRASERVVRYRQNDREFLCLREFVPTAVAQALERAGVATSGTAPLAGQSPVQPEAPSGKTELPPVGLSAAPNPFVE